MHTRISRAALCCLVVLCLVGGGLTGRAPQMGAGQGQPAGQMVYAATKVTKATVEKPAVYKPKAKAVIAVDAKTGQVLYSKGADGKRRIASISKLMTVYLVLDKVATKKYGFGSKTRITRKGIQRMSTTVGLSGDYLLRYHKSYSVRTLYTLAMVESSNAAAEQLGIWVAGSNSAFIKKMNATARKLKMKHSSFISASGLNNSDLAEYGLRYTSASRSAANLSTARDVAILCRALLTKHPGVLQTSKLYKTKVGSKTIKSTNALLKGGANYNATARYLRVDGLKTGWTPKAGDCFAGTCAPKQRVRVITVVLACSGNRFTATRSLMASLYKHYELR